MPEKIVFMLKWGPATLSVIQICLYVHSVVSCLLTDSLDIWHKYHPWGDNVTHTKKSKVKVTWVVRKSALWLWAFLTNSCFMGHNIQSIRRRCATYHFQVIYVAHFSKRSKVNATWVVWSFFLSTPKLHAYLTDAIHMCHKCNPWDEYVWCTISKSKGQGHIGH